MKKIANSKNMQPPNHFFNFGKERRNPDTGDTRNNRKEEIRNNINRATLYFIFEPLITELTPPYSKLCRLPHPRLDPPSQRPVSPRQDTTGRVRNEDQNGEGHPIAAARQGVGHRGGGALHAGRVGQRGDKEEQRLARLRIRLVFHTLIFLLSVVPTGPSRGRWQSGARSGARRGPWPRAAWGARSSSRWPQPACGRRSPAARRGRPPLGG